jgi:TPR repeat protein
LCQFGYVYHTVKKQYDKALAWFILAAMENNSSAQNNIGELYKNGEAVPQNYLCALKWFLTRIEKKNEYGESPNHIGDLFGNGYGVPLDKYKALEWYCHGGIKANINKLKNQGYHRSATDKSKSNYIIDSLY